MDNIKEIERLKKQLSALKDKALNNIVDELLRVGNPVSLQGLDLFNELASMGIKTLRLDRDNNPVLDTIDEHHPQISLNNVIGQISHRNLTKLLKHLRPIAGKDGKAGSVFTRIDPPEEMTYHEYLDYWVCTCGNFEKLEGFKFCDRQGNLIPPVFNVTEETLCRCERCGRIIRILNHTILGVNLNPIRDRF